MSDQDQYKDFCQRAIFVLLKIKEKFDGENGNYSFFFLGEEGKQMNNLLLEAKEKGLLEIK